jgi:hypothetical protein
VDNSQYQVRLTLWGKSAIDFDGNNHPVFAVKGAKVSDFGGTYCEWLSGLHGTSFDSLARKIPLSVVNLTYGNQSGYSRSTCFTWMVRHVLLVCVCLLIESDIVNRYENMGKSLEFKSLLNSPQGGGGMGVREKNRKLLAQVKEEGLGMNEKVHFLFIAF